MPPVFRGGLIDPAQDMWNDLKEAIRSLVTDRLVTLVVVATLALAIGVNTTIFSALNGILFRPSGAV